LKQFWDLKSHLQDSSSLATAHYPETLDKIFVIGAPSFFQTIWSWVKRWLDPIVVSKTYILPASEVFATLSNFIEPANIPEKYGGQLPFLFGNLPLVDPVMSEHAQRSQSLALPIGPLKWQEGEAGRMELVAVGTDHSRARREPLALLDTAYHHVFSTYSSS